MTTNVRSVEIFLLIHNFYSFIDKTAECLSKFVLQVSVLGDLSPGGAMMVGSHQDLLAEQCPLSVQSDLRQLYISVCELIRHFWDVFPPNTPELAERAKKMFETLKKFQAMKVRPFETLVERRYTPGGGHVTQHINMMLDSAYKKYNTWANKKR